MQTRVGVLRGGVSEEYYNSLKTGANVLRHLPPQFEGVDILIDRDGVWHRNGFPEEPHQIIRHTDVLYNALCGQDARLVGFIEAHNLPLIGSGSYTATLAFSRPIARQIVRKFGVLVPESILLTEENMLGKKVSVGVIENFRGQKYYTLFPMTFTDQEFSLHTGLSQYEKEGVAEVAIKVHQLLGARHYSSSVFVVKKNGTPYFLETNTHPVLMEGSFFPLALKQVGCSIPEFIKHTLKLALSRGNFFGKSNSELWTVPDSNRRPPHCKCGALPTKLTAPIAQKLRHK